MKNLLFLLLTVSIFANALAGVSTSYSTDTTIILAEPVISTFSDREITETAKVDARRDYKNPGETAISIGSSLLLFPVGGMVAVLLILKRPINPESIKLKNEAFAGNQLYNNAYLNECRKIRKKRLWLAAGITTLLVFAVGLTIYISFVNKTFLFLTKLFLLYKK